MKLVSLLFGGMITRPLAVEEIFPYRGNKVSRLTILSLSNLYIVAGYSADFSFIDHKAFKVKSDNDLLLYKRMFVPEIQPPTLVVIGYHDDIASFVNTAEMQAHYSTRVVKVSSLRSLQITTLYADNFSSCVQIAHIPHKCPHCCQYENIRVGCCSITAARCT